MTTFTTTANNAQAGVEFLLSADGLSNWQPLSQGPMFTGQTNFARDPSVIQTSFGYCVAYSQSDYMVVSTSFGVQCSSDFNSWTETNVDPGISGEQRVWAPEFFSDPVSGNVYVYVAVATTGNGGTSSNFAVYCAQVTSFSPFSVGSFSQVYSSTRFPIDPFVVYSSGTYYLWYKDNNTGYVEYASASSPTGTFSAVQTGNWAGWGATFEGPCLIKLSDRWRIYLDWFTDQIGQYYSDSFDNWASWTVPVALVTPYVANHGTTIIVH